MKKIRVNIQLQNLQIRPKMYHRQGHQQPLNLLEFQLQILIPDKTHDPQSSSNTSPERYITFEIPPSPTEEIQNETQNTSSIPNTSVNVLSPTRNNPTNSRGLPLSTYYPPSVPAMYRYPHATRQATNNRNNSQQYDPLNYTFFHHIIQIFQQITNIKNLLKIIIPI